MDKMYVVDYRPEIQKEYDLGYTNGHSYTSLYMFQEGIFTNNHVYIIGCTIFVK